MVILLVVGVDLCEEFEYCVEVFVHCYGTIMLHCPFGLQFVFFFDYLLCADGGIVCDYVDVLMIEQFGALMLFGMH